MKHEVVIPSKIRIGGWDYKVKINKAVRDHLIREGWIGNSDSYWHIIEIQPDMSQDQISKTFVHELLHCASYVYCQDKIEEREIQGLSQGLHQILKQMGVRFALKGQS